jgi:hypothetical protein
MEDEQTPGGSDGSMACPHCGKPLYLSATSGDTAPEKDGDWENDLRHTMSPQEGGGENPA